MHFADWFHARQFHLSFLVAVCNTYSIDIMYRGTDSQILRNIGGLIAANQVTVNRLQFLEKYFLNRRITDYD